MPSEIKYKEMVNESLPNVDIEPFDHDLPNTTSNGKKSKYRPYVPFESLRKAIENIKVDTFSQKRSTKVKYKRFK